MSVDGRTVRLERAVRIWRWRGARTLSEVSRDGVRSAAESGYTRVSAEVATITLLDACEVIPCTDAARLSIVTAGWAE